jgi:hypothetical protein
MRAHRYSSSHVSISLSSPCSQSLALRSIVFSVLLSRSSFLPRHHHHHTHTHNTHTTHNTTTHTLSLSLFSLCITMCMQVEASSTVALLAASTTSVDDGLLPGASIMQLNSHHIRHIAHVPHGEENK